MGFTSLQREHLLLALKDKYLEKLFWSRVKTWPLHDGCYLFAKALKESIGGELYTVSGFYQVTRAITDWHIVVKKDEVFWDGSGEKTFNELSQFWWEDNLINLQLRPFKEEDLSSIGLNCSLDSPTGISKERFFQVLHGEQFDPFIQEVTRYLNLSKEDQPQTVNLCIWPCGTFCEEEDLGEYSWMSDDYAIVPTPLGVDESVFAQAFLEDHRIKNAGTTVPDSLNPPATF